MSPGADCIGDAAGGGQVWASDLCAASVPSFLSPCGLGVTDPPLSPVTELQCLQAGWLHTISFGCELPRPQISDVFLPLGKGEGLRACPLLLRDLKPHSVSENQEQESSPHKAWILMLETVFKLRFCGKITNVPDERPK